MHEGKTLRYYLKANNKMDEVWKLLGYENQTGLYFQLKKEKLSTDFKYKIKSKLKIDIDKILKSDILEQHHEEIFDHIEEIAPQVDITDSKEGKTKKQPESKPGLLYFDPATHTANVDAFVPLLPTAHDLKGWTPFYVSIDKMISYIRASGKDLEIDIDRWNMSIQPQELYRYPNIGVDIVFIATSNNMFPLICQGDRVAIEYYPMEPLNAVSFGDAYLIIFNNWKHGIFYLRKSTNDKWWLRNKNTTDHDDKEIMINDVMCIWKVKAVTRSF